MRRSNWPERAATVGAPGLHFRDLRHSRNTLGSVAGSVVGGLLLAVVPTRLLAPGLAALLLASAVKLWRHCSDRRPRRGRRRQGRTPRRAAREAGRS